MSWCFDDEPEPYGDRVLLAAPNSEVYSSPIWELEASNALLMAERRKRVTPERANAIAELLAEMDIRIEPFARGDYLGRIREIGRQFGLTSYDASYLDVSLRLQIPLATIDKKLIQAAKKAGVSIFNPS